MKQSVLFIAAAVALAMGGCKSSKEQAKLPAGETLVDVYCSGSDYFSTKDYFRANAIGESLDQMTAKKKALANARQELASSINTTIKAVVDNYVNSREFNNKEEVEERFESLSREIVNQELTGLKTICEKQTKTTEGRYKTYLALELSGTDLVMKMSEKLSKDERLKIDYDYEKFKKTFEEEMKKMEQQSN